MVYVTGDLHGDIERFKTKAMKKLRKGDTLIVCGDFGFLWSGGEKERKLLKWIGKRRYNVLFLEGTHDNLALLSEYPQVEWCGGMVHEITGKLRHLCRGYVFTVEELRIFAFGGGECYDFALRAPDISWWGGELPSAQEIEAARVRLQDHSNQVDYIVTHQASRKIGMVLSMEHHNVNLLDAFLDEVRESCRYRRWFFGSYHLNKNIPPAEMALFDAVVPITAEKME